MLHHITFRPSGSWKAKPFLRGAAARNGVHGVSRRYCLASQESDFVRHQLLQPSHLIAEAMVQIKGFMGTQKKARRRNSVLMSLMMTPDRAEKVVRHPSRPGVIYR